MKKLLVMLTMVMTFAFASVCAAYDGGVLNKEQKAAEAFTNAVTGQTVTYDQVAAGLNVELKKQVTEEAIANLQKQVKEQYGTLNNTRFVSFERYADADKLVYVASFSKEQVVAMVYVFDAKQKLVSFSYRPVRNEAPQEEAQK